MTVWEKLKKFIACCPLVVLMIVTTLGFSLYALIMVCQGKYAYNLSMNRTLFSAVMAGEKKIDSKDTDIDEEDEVVKDASEDSSKDQTAKESSASKSDAASETSATEATTEVPSVAYTGTDVDVFWNSLEVCETPIEKGKERKALSPYYDDNDETAKTTIYNYQTVDNSYFDDALFIGDSRIEGLKTYSKFEKATFYSEEGVSVFSLFEDRIATVGKEKMTIPEALKTQQFNKIYIMVGINELGQGYAKEYQEQYQKNIETITKLQPNAVVFIMSIMKMSAQKVGSDTVFNNDNIENKNVLAAKLANGVNVFYLDMNAPFMNEQNTGIKESYTWDGVHLKAEYYELWESFLKQHGLSKDRFPMYKDEVGTTTTQSVTTETSTTQASESDDLMDEEDDEAE